MNVSDWCSWGRHDECRSPLCACDCGCQERNEGKKD